MRWRIMAGLDFASLFFPFVEPKQKKIVLEFICSDFIDIRL